MILKAFNARKSQKELYIILLKKDSEVFYIDLYMFIVSTELAGY